MNPTSDHLMSLDRDRQTDAVENRHVERLKGDRTLNHNLEVCRFRVGADNCPRCDQAMTSEHSRSVDTVVSTWP